MKIKRFLAKDMSEAIALVRESLGADSVIISTKRVDDQVELIAAVDYEQSELPAAPTEKKIIAERPREELPITKTTVSPKKSAQVQDLLVRDPAVADLYQEVNLLRYLLENQIAALTWQKAERQSPQEAYLFRRLLALGFEVKVCRMLSREHAHFEEKEQGWIQVLQSIRERIAIETSDVLNYGGIVALLGTTGVGKTMTIAKIAAQFAMKHGASDIAILTTDVDRVGAQESLKIYGKLLGVPVTPIHNDQELGKALQGLRDKKLVLIDTPGFGQRDSRIQAQIDLLQRFERPITQFLLLSATAESQNLHENIQAYHQGNIHSVILTKIDEAVCLGAPLSVLLQHRLSLAYVSAGQNIPEDLKPADISELLESAQSVNVNQERTVENSKLAMAYDGRLVNVDV